MCAQRRAQRRAIAEALCRVESSCAALHQWGDGQVRAPGFLIFSRRGHRRASRFYHSEAVCIEGVGRFAVKQEEGLMKLTGAEILCESLTRLGVRYIFGYPGGAILPVYDALGK